MLGGVEDLGDGDPQLAGDLDDGDVGVGEAVEEVAGVDVVGEGGFGGIRAHGDSCSPWVGVGQGGRGVGTGSCARWGWMWGGIAHGSVEWVVWVWGAELRFGIIKVNHRGSAKQNHDARLFRYAL